MTAVVPRRAATKVDRDEVFVEFTRSICPVCKAVIDAQVNIRNDKVYLRKPSAVETAPDPYRYAARVCGVEPAQMDLVAVHPWDIDGARRVGLAGIWVDRHESPYPTTFLPPTLRVADLEGIADARSGAGS